MHIECMSQGCAAFKTELCSEKHSLFGGLDGNVPLNWVYMVFRVLSLFQGILFQNLASWKGCLFRPEDFKTWVWGMAMRGLHLCCQQFSLKIILNPRTRRDGCYSQAPWGFSEFFPSWTIKPQHLAFSSVAACLFLARILRQALWWSVTCLRDMRS